MKLFTEQLMPSETEQTISKLTSLMNSGGGEQTRAACIACGQCATECFLTESYPDINPQQLVDQVLTGKKQELIDSEFIWACTLSLSYWCHVFKIRRASFGQINV
jgi:heterodisulfide reductase subunit C